MRGQEVRAFLENLHQSVARLGQTIGTRIYEGLQITGGGVVRRLSLHLFETRYGLLVARATKQLGYQRVVVGRHRGTQAHCFLQRLDGLFGLALHLHDI